MKKFWEAVIVLTLIIAGFLFLWPRHASINVSSSQTGTNSQTSNAPGVSADVRGGTSVGNAASSNVIVPDPLASHANSPNTTPAAVTETNALSVLPPAVALDKARVILHNYRAAIAEYPVGTNPEITAALKGKNPKQTDFLSDSGLHTNEKGELLDGYGTPFFFHQLSGKEMEIRSAGPDQILWTTDDLVTK